MKIKIFCIVFLVLSANVSLGQAVSYYPFSSLLSLSTNPCQTVWLDARIQMNSFTSSLSTELAPAVNLNSNTKARIYVGGGARFNFLSAAFTDSPALEGYFLNVGVRSSLWEKYPGFQLLFELSPYTLRGFDLGTFRANLGIGYNFSRKK